MWYRTFVYVDNLNRGSIYWPRPTMIIYAAHLGDAQLDFIVFFSQKGDYFYKPRINYSDIIWTDMKKDIQAGYNLIG